jgi:hypothetical protein
MTRSRKLALLGALIAWMTIARAAIADDRAPSRPTPTACYAFALDGDGSLSATLVDAPLDQVLDQLSRETGIMVTWTAPRRASRRTLSFHGLPLTAALARVLARENYLLLSSHDRTGRPQLEVRIGSPSDGRPIATATKGAAAPPVAMPQRDEDLDRARATFSGMGDGDHRADLGTIGDLVEREASPAQLGRLWEMLESAAASDDGRTSSARASRSPRCPRPPSSSWRRAMIR